MSHRILKLYFFTLVFLMECGVSVGGGDAQTKSWKPEVPKTWIDDEMAALEIPLFDPASSPKQIPSDYYYRIPVRPIYRSYPVYAPGKAVGEDF